ncbi:MULTISPECIES: transposase [Pseudomonas]|uniref:Transposase n=1 Tax=Pseudomonas luteola TaxID=47886 RepID=A0ABS0FM92_PSELU|nr:MULTISPECIES: transposase [Pseudomonas]MBA1246537.1 transposase [Pseudomonas zeshuii]MBF8641447.1 transposase [Pseudomonas zeshuii]QEU27220.1 transposase [Pseudomonas luteola]RRW50103.1 transposase [Pseudomonas luteola]
MRHRKEITAALWKRIKPLLPEHKISPKDARPFLDDELALNGLIFLPRTGIPW